MQLPCVFFNRYGISRFLFVYRTQSAAGYGAVACLCGSDRLLVCEPLTPSCASVLEVVPLLCTAAFCFTSSINVAQHDGHMFLLVQCCSGFVACSCAL
jgi:hypothetical protein